MSTPVTQVQVSLVEPSGTPLVGARIVARLDVPQLDLGVIVPGTVTATTGSAGTATLPLWPNVLSEVASTYIITITHPTMRRVLLRGIVVPERTSITLRELLGGDAETVPPGALSLAGGSLTMPGGYLTITTTTS